jgi:hypothetical protein
MKKEDMGAKILSVLAELYAKQEQVDIKYTIGGNDEKKDDRHGGRHRFRGQRIEPR